MMQKMFWYCLLMISPIFIVAQGNDFDSIRLRELKPENLKADFNYFRNILEATHPGLYRYQTREALQHKYDSCLKQLEGGGSFGDFYFMLADLVSDIRCAHTTLMPAANFMGLFDSSPIFPYRLRIHENKTYVLFNCSTDPTVQPGFELVSVNGMSNEEFLKKMTHLMPADGYNLTAKTYLVGQPIFFLYAALAIGQPNSYHFVLKDLQGRLIERDELAVPSKLISKRILKNSANRKLLALYKPIDKLESTKKWRLEIDKQQKLARIVFRTFALGKDNDDAKLQMQQFMAKSMREIRESNIEDLIVDIRWNAGGYDAQALELYRWVIDTASYNYHSLHAVTLDSQYLRTSTISKKELDSARKMIQKNADGLYFIPESLNSSLAIQHPREDRYKGRLYFLIAGSTGSSAAEFAAAAKAHQLGIFVGEETGGNYSGGNGGEFLNVTLPYTKFRLTIPLLYYRNAVTGPFKEGYGTLPDHDVPLTIKDMLTGSDSQLEFVKKLIKQNKK